ncbi:MAG TPA: tetratricopeptide repeat protein [Anaerolineales bacterium]|jgi:predicted ATPase/transcriptional regulator with XRE-family HTH domain|nr:tetratricopeptide repeat protein [Anaerolineales bacterium]
MQEQHSFGYWLRLKRKALELTREALADRVGCSVSTIRKLEDEERRPSAQIAELLAEIFKIPTTERPAFLRFARGDWRSAPSPGDEETPWRISTPALPQQPRSNVPATFTSLIGRNKDIAAVQDYLTNPAIRLVTLIGPGGIGKTRLSIASASKSLDEFSDGVFFVALAPLDQPSLIPSATLQALGYIEKNNLSPEERLIEGIANKRMLLVLDNCEHLIDDIARFASSLLSACSHLKILTTSREALRIPGEWLYSVPALDMPKEYSIVNVETISEFPALALFAERARAARSDFALNAENIRAVASICTRLDGLPLAIELIAARVKTLSIEQIAARLDDRFALLTSSSRVASSRQQTLRATLDWSYELLTEPEKDLFRQLSVFVGGFTLEALESVALLDSNPSILDALSRLVDKSLLLVEQRDQPRYRFLEPIRQYARDKLNETGESNLIQDRHLHYYLRVAEEAEPYLYGAGQYDWKKRLEWDHDNLRVALGWSLESDQIQAGLKMAGALAWFWHNKGHLSEGNLWLEKTLASGIGIQGKERAKALRASSILSTGTGDYIQARAFAESSVKLYREMGDNLGAGVVLADLGASLHWGGKEEEAIESLEESLHLLRATGERWELAYALLWLGDTWFRTGDIERAATTWEESLLLTRELGDHYLIAWSLGGLADVARLRGDYKRATETFRESLSLYLSSGSKFGPPFSLEALGLVAAALGDAKRAARLWGAASAWREAINQPLPPTYQRDYAPSVAQARTQLGEEVYASAWSEGHAMSPEQAIALALEE